MDTSELSTIRDVVAPIAARYDVERMYLFGSRARGDNRPDSDYDFLISSGKLDSLWKFAGFWAIWRMLFIPLWMSLQMKRKTGSC